MPVPALPAASPAVHLTGVAESTTTIVIGSGFSGLAVAAELNRQGIDAIVVDGFRQSGPSTPAPTTGGISLDAISERHHILRLLEHYAHRHQLDIRPASCPLELSLHGIEATPEGAWTVRTSTGSLTAHSVVFTRGALNQLRRVLRKLGVTTGQELTAAMQSLGLYLVGVGELVVPTTTEILHQAKRASAAISARTAASLPFAAAVPA